MWMDVHKLLPFCLGLAITACSLAETLQPGGCGRYTGAALAACNAFCVTLDCAQPGPSNLESCNAQWARFSRLTDGNSPPCLNLCDHMPEAPASSSRRESLAAGSYDVELVATKGSRQGHRIHAQLRLVALSSGSHFSSDVRLAGSLEGDLSAVGAPLCADEKPAAESEAPLAPGVLVHQAGGRQYLTVANWGNRSESGADTFPLRADGCGISFGVDEAAGGRFRGRWGAFGIAVDGCGTFEARALSLAPF